MDGDLLDALTGGDGHLDVIKVHDHDDNLSTKLWFFVFLIASNQEKSLKLQSLCLNP